MEKGKKKLSTHEHIELLKNLRNLFNNQEIRKMLDMYNKQRLKRIKKEGKFIELYNVLSEEEYEKYLKQCHLLPFSYQSLLFEANNKD